MKKVHSVGVFRSQGAVSAPPLGYVLQAISDELLRRGIAIHHLDQKGFDIRTFVKSETYRKLDGLMDLPWSKSPSTRALYEKTLREKHCVFFSFHEKNPKVNRVNNDELSMLRQLVGHLVDEEHRLIGYAFGKEGPWSAARRESFLKALRENHLAPRREWIGKDTDIFSRFASAKAGRPRPTALVFDTDETLFRFEDFAKKKKIRIPEDVAIAGADNDHFEAGRRGKLLHTSSAVDFYGQGRAGALMMVGLLSGKIPPFGNVETIRAKLIVRRSSLRRSLVRKTATEDTFKEVVASYLEVHGTEEEAGDEIARHVGMARYYFRKKFSRVFGRTLGEHLSSLRAEKAAVLLRSTDKPVTWIMHEVGFSTHQTFTAAFRKRFGMRAQEYRKSG